MYKACWLGIFTWISASFPGAVALRRRERETWSAVLDGYGGQEHHAHHPPRKEGGFTDEAAWISSISIAWTNNGIGLSKSQLVLYRDPTIIRM